MLQTPDNIEASTMTYVFDMFGKSVTQMLQASINQQTAIDELRAQIRSCQAQITNICGTLEELEDRTFVKLQEMRPTIYTRDGLPLDDALEMLQNKVQATAEKSVSQDEAIARLDVEVKAKLDVDQFENTSKATTEMTDSFEDISMTIQSIQKELQKQRSESDSIFEKCTQLVQMQVQRLGTQMAMNDDFGEGESKFVTRKKFHEVISKLQKGGGMGLAHDESDLFDENDLEGTLDKIKKHSAALDDEYNRRKSKLDANLNKVLSLLGEGNEEEEEAEYEYFESEDFDIGSDFEVDVENDQEVELRDIGIEIGEDVDEKDEITIGETRTLIPKTNGKRRNVGLACDKDKSDENGDGEEEEGEGGKKRRRKKKTKKQLLIEEVKRQKEKVGGVGGGSAESAASKIDDSKLTQNITAKVMTKIEPLLVDLFANIGIGGVKLDKNDAKQLVSQLMVLSQLRDDMAKLKMLVSIKYDRVEAENELAIRITRDEFFNMLLNLFPSNTALQKAYTNYKKKLPPLKSTSHERESRSRSRNDDGEEKSSYTIHQRQIKTAVPGALVPARNSRLLALNQKFLKGADGKYYLRDIGSGESGVQTSSNMVGIQSKTSTVNPEQAFDYQPFLPSSAMKEPVERIQVPSQHRARTPPDPND
ncbi:hypothetical protein TRFO_12715 [Tritrichomonas foetus]|uniref:Uncharacterized protein n=1 Tax=Tritrichomonas foetus TaxID=1144522 RepID=A0A1J4L4V8_9EUKA|nr:hypothetical protein TRFO_12715 [Tritrichomonas foetus]|eukprot:OHT17020.1 hypothetical protein TRFO_12715 [Tritrichomonas foetus]